MPSQCKVRLSVENKQTAPKLHLVQGTIGKYPQYTRRLARKIRFPGCAVLIQTGAFQVQFPGYIAQGFLISTY